MVILFRFVAFAIESHLSDGGKIYTEYQLHIESSHLFRLYWPRQTTALRDHGQDSKVNFSPLQIY